MAAVTLTAVLAAGTATLAEAHPDVPKWFQYNKVTWTKTWRDFPRYRREYDRWRARHQCASANQAPKNKAGVDTGVSQSGPAGVCQSRASGRRGYTSSDHSCGDGVAGGTFESWVRVVDDDEYARLMNPSTSAADAGAKE